MMGTADDGDDNAIKPSTTTTTEPKMDDDDGDDSDTEDAELAENDDDITADDYLVVDSPPENAGANNEMVGDALAVFRNDDEDRPTLGEGGDDEEEEEEEEVSTPAQRARNKDRTMAETIDAIIVQADAYARAGKTSELTGALSELNRYYDMALKEKKKQRQKIYFVHWRCFKAYYTQWHKNANIRRAERDTPLLPATLRALEHVPGTEAEAKADAP
jgi:hypothetical protein